MAPTLTVVHGPHGPTSEQIEEALSAVLKSTAFRASKQSQHLLQYLVDQTLQGHNDMLKERIVGLNVFDRSPDYDTGNDPIVRVRAADLRKRLAQYYTGEGADTSVRIKIEPGSYQPAFVLFSQQQVSDLAAEEKRVQPAEPETDASPIIAKPSTGIVAPHSRHARRKYYLWAGTAIGFLGILWTGLVALRHKTPIDLFWAPVLRSSKPVLIYFGTDAVYRLSNDFLDKYRASHNVEQEGREFFVDLPPGTKIDISDLAQVRNSLTGDDIAAAADVISFLDRGGKPFQLRWAHDISNGDLGDNNVILVGGFNNDLTLKKTGRLPLFFEGGNEIRDQKDLKRTWSISHDSKGESVDDYAVVSRLIDPTTGAILITVAGIGGGGTRAAGSFLTSPQQITEAVSRAPVGWNQRNLQILLHVRIIDSVPNSMNVVCVYSW